MRSIVRICLSGLVLLMIARGVYADDPAVTVREFIFDTAPFKSCHASTLAELPDGTLVAAWFGGKAEGKSDVGIWFARREANRWSAPVEVANGNRADGSREPCWNPVLYQDGSGSLLLFYKISGSPSTWTGMLITSTDGGRKWSLPQSLPVGVLGPIKNKPVHLSDGTLLCPTSIENDGWRVYFERTSDLGKTWDKTAYLNDGTTISAIQPTLLDHGSAGLQALCRTRQQKIGQSWSHDGGKTWEPLTLTNLPNPNSGIDAVQLKDGRSLLVYNHTPKRRSPLNLALSAEGKTWQAGPVLETEPGEYSYPAVIQTTDGKIHITYTWKREKIRHLVVDPAHLKSPPMADEK